MAREVSRLPGKEVHVYRTEDPMRLERLTEKLERVYGRGLNDGALDAATADSRRLTELLFNLKYHSGLDGRSVYVLEYYLNFLSVPERFEVLRQASEAAEFSAAPVDFLPVRVQNGIILFQTRPRARKR